MTADDPADGPPERDGSDMDGDPFAELAGGSSDDAVSGDDPFAELGGDADADPDFADPDPADPDSADPVDVTRDLGGGSDIDDPFSDLEDADLGGTDGDVFERMEVDELRDEDVWDALDASAVGVGGEATPAGDAGRDHLVDKRNYCQRCPHFSKPPETACTHEEGTIVEVVETEEFRVRNCPMVGEDGPRFDHG